MVPPIIFDRLSLVILWNAGCAGCLPIIEELSEFGAGYGVPCYGVAVTVRDIEVTAAAAKASMSKALLALEERPANLSGLARGWVTRHWLEASGYPGVPAAFIVDETGTVVWMGDPEKIKPAFFSIAKGVWDTKAERERWKAEISDNEIHTRRIVLDLSDLFIAGNIEAAKGAIATAEQEWPALAIDTDFNVLKLDVLTSSADSHGVALAHYAQCACNFESDRDLQLRLATRVLSRMPANKAALETVIERLTPFDNIGAPMDGGAQREMITRIMCCLTLAGALARAGLRSEATQRVDRAAAAMSENDALPTHIKTWIASEIEKLRKSL